MRRYILFILSLVLVTSLADSCKKDKFTLSDEPFIVEAKNVQATSVWVDIIPETNDFWYYYEITSVEQYDKEYKTDQGWIDSIDKSMKDLYDLFMQYDLGDDFFRDYFLYRDALCEGYFFNGLLDPETDYYLIVFPYDSDLNPMKDKYVKVRFRTTKEVFSDITFDVSATGSVVTVKPSNGDPYYWDYETVENVEEEYYGSPYHFYNELIDLYVAYDFLENMISVGEDSEDMSDYYDLEPGDQLYLCATGYENGMTTKLFTFLITYNGEGKAATVVPYDEYANPVDLMSARMEARARSGLDYFLK